MAQNALVVQDNSFSPISALQLMADKGLDINQLPKMLEIQERWDAMQAKKAYTKAMAGFKADPPYIFKDKTVTFETKAAGKASYSHASLGNITHIINESLAAHGLSAGWKTDQDSGVIKVTCTITHELGHSESSTLMASPDNSGAKNSIQAVGSTITYLERYSLLALTGLATHDQDDDGRGGVISPEELELLQQEIKAAGADEELFLKWAKVPALKNMPTALFGQAIKRLKQKQQKKANATKIDFEEIADTPEPNDNPPKEPQGDVPKNIPDDMSVEEYNKLIKKEIDEAENWNKQ
jgi:hypothetical protein